MAKIQFLGAAGTVTGSRHLVHANGRKVLIDAGLFQGKKELRERNWKPLPVPPAEIDAILLTHAHIDHTGYLPVIVRDGFKGRVLTTPATKDLSSLMLPDSGRLQEEEAGYANKTGYSKHAPNAKPLYTEADAKAALTRFDTVAYDVRHELFPGIAVVFRPAGHILGSATIEVELDEPGRRRQRIVFTGDLGRYDAPVIPDPAPVREATTLLVESTYGDRAHGTVSPKEALEQSVKEAEARQGAIVIPAFAIGRTQEILYHLRELETEGRIQPVDVFVDSPMAVDATPMYVKHAAEHDAEMRGLLERGVKPFHPQRVHFTRTVEESKRINAVRRCIIISASGMATGGRVLHHMKQRLPDPRNTILFVGYQSDGTRGRTLQDGAKDVKIHGEFVKVGAQIRTVSGFSAHADYLELMRWMDGFQTPPERVFCVHGEDKGLAGMKQKVEARGPQWKAYVPGYMETVELD